MSRSFLAMALLLGGSFSVASTPVSSTSKTIERQVGRADSPIKDLVSALSGRWSIVETYEDRKTDKGEEVWRTPPDRIQLIEEYHSVDTGT
jgi:hypothetical protein